MATIAELIAQKDGEEAVRQIRKAFFPLKPGFKAKRSHVGFELLEDNHVKVTLPTGTDVYAKMSGKSRNYFLEFLEDIPEGYRKRAIDAWDKILVSLGVRRKRKAWNKKGKKKKERKGTAKGRAPSGGNRKPK
jgi:hypothetical protein